MSEKKNRIRVSVTLTKIYVDGIDHLVDEGLYLDRGQIFLEALRILLGIHGISPFYLEAGD